MDTKYTEYVIILLSSFGFAKSNSYFPSAIYYFFTSDFDFCDYLITCNIYYMFN